jgi:hypothetical protein
MYMILFQFTSFPFLSHHVPLFPGSLSHLYKDMSTCTHNSETAPGCIFYMHTPAHLHVLT